MENRTPPYYQNFSNSHCLQCSLRSALEYFKPEKLWTWKELEDVSFKREGHGTWHMGFLSQLGKHGYDVVCIEDFNLKEFVASPSEYMKTTQSPESFEYAMQDMDIAHEVKCSKLLLEAEEQGLAELHYRNSTAEDVRHYLKNGYLIVLNVNSSALWRHEGFTGHFVLIYKLLDENTLLIHDNGGMNGDQPTGMNAMKMEIDFLIRCGTSGDKTTGFYAIRPKQTKNK